MTETYEHYLWRKGCQGKVRFITRRSAKRFYKKRDWKKKERLQVYHCQFCEFFHLGHKRKESY